MSSADFYVKGSRRVSLHAESRPIWEQMREYLASKAMMNVMPKELFGQALTYLRNQFEHLLVYLDDGLMPIDNNETEQLMKQVAGTQELDVHWQRRCGLMRCRSHVAREQCAS